jgi:4-hydroxy-tetrahydrodipicolinate reductase
MDRITIMINGLPGNVAKVIARHALADTRVTVLPYSLTGPEIDAPAVRIGDTDIELIHPRERDSKIGGLIERQGAFISVDFTHPTAVNANAEFYVRHNLPFVMGTTGGDREQLAAQVRGSSVSAVIAPNMAKQIVGFQAMMNYAAEHFPNLFKGYHLTIRESHQAGKADTSGTAKAMVRYFNQLGVPFSEDEIVKIRDPGIQKNQLGIAEAYLTGHGWHTYTLVSEDQTVRFEFTHNVNGRKIYAGGTLNALLFLFEKVKAGARGKMFTMIDVLKGN